MNFNKKIINVRNYLRGRLRTHTIESASIYSDEHSELSIEQLDGVIGGMSEESFDAWRTGVMNEKED